MRLNRSLLKGWVTLGLNIRLKGYVYRQYLYTVRQENGSTTTLVLEVFIQKNYSNLYSIELEFCSQKLPFLSHLLEELGVTYALRLQLVGKLVVDFLFVIIEHFRQPLRFRCYISRYWSKSAFSKVGWVTSSANFRWKGTSPTNLFWCQELITLSCDFKISAVFSFVSSQNTREAEDGRTDGRTDRRTDGQNYNPQDRASIAASRSKNALAATFTLYNLSLNHVKINKRCI